MSLALIVRVLVGIGVVCGAIYIANQAQVPPPLKWAMWVVAFVVFLVIFLPLAGVSLH